jgi:hypothetical protein
MSLAESCRDAALLRARRNAALARFETDARGALT